MLIQYKKKRNLLQNLLLVELAQGMWLTLKTMFSKPITLQYPHEQPHVFRGFRGQHALVRDPKKGNDTRCIGCMRCMKVCPSQCIEVKTAKDPETGKRVISQYNLDALRCVYCGYCAEVCPVNAIVLTEVFAYIGTKRSDLAWDKSRLLENWDSYLAGTGETLDNYVNPIWRPKGMPDSSFSPAKRLPVDDEWKGINQVVGKNWQAAARKQSR